MVTGLRRLSEADLNGKRVVMRADFNVPINDGRITSRKRIIEALPTIKYLMDKSAGLTLLSHLGRPQKPGPEFSLAPVKYELEKFLGINVQLISNLGIHASEKLSILENTRFFGGEERNDDDLARTLSSFGDVFVFDAFGVAHRNHASVSGIAKYLPAYAGFLVERELDFLSELMDNIKRPYMVVMGGSKISDKINLINSFRKLSDTVLVGGALATSFLKAEGYQVGISRYDSEGDAKKILSSEKADKLRLPNDVIVEDQQGKTRETVVTRIRQEEAVFDIGSKTAGDYAEVLKKAKTIVFNGPLGMVEDPRFRAGTKRICEAIRESGAISVACGGDTAAFIESEGLEDCFSYVSTGGGAFLEALEGRELPGLKAIVR